MTSFSGVTFVLFCFVVVFMVSLKPRSFVQSSFDMQAPRYPHMFLSFLFFFSFCLCGDVAFSEYFVLFYFCTIYAFSLYGEHVVRYFLPNGVYLLCDHGLDFFTLASERIQSIKKINK